MLRFINNFDTTLAQALDTNSGAVFIQSTDAARLVPLLDMNQYTHQLLLTLYDDTNVEIIVIDEAYADTGELYAYRGKEDTTARAWPVGTKVSARPTARSVSALPILGVAMQLTDADGLLQDQDGNILINPDIPTFFGGADPFGLTDI